jgi:hypothetical protein
MSKNTHQQNTNALMDWLISLKKIRYVVNIGYVKIKSKFEKVKEELYDEL